MSELIRREFLGATGALMAGMVASPAVLRAQAAWPTRDIQIIIAVAVGTTSDTLSRVVAKVMSREFKVPVTIKTVLGGAGLNGIAELAASKADGSIIGVVNVGGLLVFPHIMKVPYSWDNFSFLGAYGEVLYGLGVAPDSPLKSVDDLIALGKTRRVTYTGGAIMNGVALIQLGNLTGAKFQYVPANTPAESAARAIGGHVDLCVQTPADLTALLENKQIRLLASASDARWPKEPDVKTLKELGHNASTIVPLGFACPSGVPKDLQVRLEEVIAMAAKEQELLDMMKTVSIQPRAMTGKQFHDALRAQAPVVEEGLVAANMKKT